jgi:hypothetical protein
LDFLTPFSGVGRHPKELRGRSEEPPPDHVDAECFRVAEEIGLRKRGGFIFGRNVGKERSEGEP